MFKAFFFLFLLFLMTFFFLLFCLLFNWTPILTWELSGSPAILSLGISFGVLHLVTVCKFIILVLTGKQETENNERSQVQPASTEGKTSTLSRSDAPQGSPEKSTPSLASNIITYMKIKREKTPEADNGSRVVLTKARSKWWWPEISGDSQSSKLNMRDASNICSVSKIITLQEREKYHICMYSKIKLQK